MSRAGAGTVVGFIGAGQMGEPMVHRLLGAGHKVVVYARRAEVRQRLADAGVSVADSVADVAAQADVLVLCLFSDAQLREVASGETGFMANAKPGAVVVSHVTGNVATLEALVADHPDGPSVVDAPVSGSADDISAGKLTVLLGGAEGSVERAESVLVAYADPIVRTGGLGSALNLKLVNNVLFAANAQLVAAAVELGQKLGIGDAELLSAVALSSGRSHALNSVKLLGGLDRFGAVAAPFLRKDVAACATAADAAGIELGWLRSVVDSGPLDLS
ncbi:NAD(P)-dependent oxidoreductase [Rhodococcus gannanensis]|uniref:NAD(P)-dependent oxidoreductase n=1 Tax=Rhodococcus gannanensis TaxID=1960308 RepID=A0ABW4P550_9NOCA